MKVWSQDEDRGSVRSWNKIYCEYFCLACSYVLAVSPYCSHLIAVELLILSSLFKLLKVYCLRFALILIHSWCMICNNSRVEKPLNKRGRFPLH